MRRVVRKLALLAGCVGAACGGDDTTPAPVSPVAAETIVVHLRDVVDASGEGSKDIDLPKGGTRNIVVDLDGAARIVEIASTVSTIRIGGANPSTWVKPRPITAPTIDLTLAGEEATRVTISARGAPVPAVRRERSLVWTDPAIVDDKSIVGLAKVLAAASDDGHGGVMIDRWFRRFATTTHSERAAPASLIGEVASKQGADPKAWKLDELPFLVTGVHNRLDLAEKDHCGELRVSLASTHPVFSPMHLIFLFQQKALADDRAPDGTVHCLGTTRRWARLASLDGAPFVDAARRVLAEAITKERFLLAETVELTVSPWEWRQWTRTAPDTLDNPPLFQTVDVDALNPAGARRDDFLAFVAANADALDARTLELPERFRAPSARVAQGTPRIPLDLNGLSPAATQSHPNLRRQIEIVGCPACHTEHADFVQTTRERTFSPFYDAELNARAKRLDAMSATGDVPARRFGPLQD